MSFAKRAGMKRRKLSRSCAPSAAMYSDRNTISENVPMAATLATAASRIGSSHSSVRG